MRRVTRSSILVVSVLVIGVLIAEVTLRSLRATPVEFPFHAELYPFVGFRQPANYSWRSPGPSLSSRAGERAVAFNNADGLRVPYEGYELTREKPEGQVRIAVLGASTVHGGTTFDVTLPGALKRLLLERHPGRDIEVIAAGTIGAIARQELVSLVTTLVDYELDLLITYDGINDSGQMLYFERRPGFPYHFHVLERAWEEHRAERREAPWRVLMARSAVARRLFPRLRRELSDNRIPYAELIAEPELRRAYAAEYVDCWARIAKVSEAYGIEPFFVLQPCSLYGKFEDAGIDANPHDELFANYLVYEDFRRAVREFAAEHAALGVRDHADLIPDVDSYWDGAHVYDEVNDTIALALYELIRPTLEALL